MPSKSVALKKVKVSLPFGIGSAEWESDITERKAAWCLYIELVTRIAVEPSSPQNGLVREAFSSLHSLFSTTRQILRDAGPEIGATSKSVGGIAITVLNRGIRPFLTKWHPELQTWEAQRDPITSPLAHEKRWEQHDECLKQLDLLRTELQTYATALGVIAGIA